MTTTIAAPVRETLNLRIKPSDRSLIDRAASLTGKTRTDFVLQAARIAAENALLDSTLLTITPGAYADFIARLEAPPAPNDRLKRSIAAKPPWPSA